ncbi:DnaB-like helicase C-terminal domain-containing protein [uncultured Ruminococcus sp.]|uniref:DnaB-like helicase C-terminal domain-containing protein n=1 Tax=uncultured Ruminococcus sp. TaxID=165186 RepID=UPI0025FFE3A4|nr:DnaB-like helicase C-terminal domain-containing protein [uncultured Ruminococcus sp.]
MNIENQTQYILLGAVLTFSEYADVLQDLEIDDFCPELHDAFAAIHGYWEHNDKWNPVEVMGRYDDDCKKAMGECLDAFGAEFIRNVTHDMMLGWARIVKEQAALARARGLAFRIVDGSTRYADLTGIYEQLGEAINLHSERSDFIPMCDGIDNYIRKLDDKPEYISTGLRVLDNNLHLVPGNFVVIGGRPSAGKTALSLQLACEIAKSGRKVAYFSLETDPDTLYARIIANQLGVPLHTVKNKTVSINELDRLADIKKYPLFVRSAAGKSVGWIRTQSIRMQAKVVFIDYLQLIHQAGAKDRYSAVTEISMALHEFAQSTGTLVVALAQLNRETARAGIPPTAADLRESGQIEQDADAIILLAQNVTTKKRPEQHYHFALEKNKEGNVGSLDITFQMKTQQFKECMWM